MTDSTTGGYLLQTTEALPGGVTLQQFIQRIICGITGLGQTVVRPKWQVNPPKQLPNPEDNYCMFRVSIHKPDANAYLETYDETVIVEEVETEISYTKMQRHEELAVLCSFYGSNCELNAANLRDGFQVEQNLAVMRTAKIGFKETSDSTYVPELHGQVWFPRCDITVYLRRQLNKTVEVLSVVGAEGTIQGLQQSDEVITTTWEVEE